MQRTQLAWPFSHIASSGYDLGSSIAGAASMQMLLKIGRANRYMCNEVDMRACPQLKIQLQFLRQMILK